jgi:uncharacterized protein YjiS (DUF1127 family)
LLKTERAMSLNPACDAVTGAMPARAVVDPAASLSPAKQRPPFGKRLSAAMTASFKNFSAALRHRRELEQLAGFSDRELRDLAVTRNDIAFALAEPLWRDPATAFRQVRCKGVEPKSKT